MKTIAEIVQSASPEIRFAAVSPLSTRLEPQLRAWRLGATILTAFGLLGLMIAAAGLYAVLAFDVAQRRFELAVRAALGATTFDLMRALAARTLIFTLAGVAAGVVVALAGGRLFEALLFDVQATEPRTYVAAVAVLCGAAMAAFVLPIRRAQATDPARALRQE